MIRKQLLDNGLTVLTERIPHVRSVCVGVWLRRGSRHETPRQNGISHFIEHLVFKGTETRSARDIALTMDAFGGQLDAFTSRESTCFYAKVLDRHLPETLELLADIVQRPLFDPEELERERRVILEEIRMVEDAPEELLYDLFAGAFFPRHRLGRPIQGTAETVGAMSRRQLLRFFRDAYRPGRMLLVAAGNLRHADLVRRARRAFAELPPGGGDDRAPAPPRPRAAVTTRARRELGQLHLLLGLPTFAEGSPRRYAVAVLNAILGGAMSSRLFQRIREERGLAYSVYSSVNAFADGGFLGIYAGTSPEQGREVVRLAMGELRQLRDDGPTEREVEIAREHLKGSMMLSLESTTSRMANLARQELYLGRQLELGETLEGLDRVGREEVHELARELVGSRRLAVAAVGRIGRLARDPEAYRL